MSQRGIRLLLSALIVLPALLVFFAPAVYSFKWLIDYSVQAMFLYFGLGFFFLFFNKNYWLSLTWGSCIALSMFLKYTSNEAFSFEQPSGGKIIKVANYNISFVDSVQSIINNIQTDTADIISIQEVTPDLDSLIKTSLSKSYRYFYSIKRADYYGMILLSKIPFSSIDTFNFRNVPNIVSAFTIPDYHRKLTIITSYCAPSYSNSTYQFLKEHLKAIAEVAKQKDGAIITIGTYNTVPWAPEVQDFKKIAKLNDSRLGFAPTSASSSNPLFQIPIDHIFYSEFLKCTNFTALNYSTNAHLGIEATFELLP